MRPMPIMRHMVASFILICLTGVAAMGFEPMTATIRVSGGERYDYAVIGEHPKATDGYDNAYDTISPGNLNADMGEPYISVLVLHPEWQPAMRVLRGDIRALKARQEWQLTVSSSLPAGTPLKVELQWDRTTLPKGVKLTLKDGKTGKENNLASTQYTFPAPGPGENSKLAIIAEQP